jgi:hypothetical protein
VEWGTTALYTTDRAARRSRLPQSHLAIAGPAAPHPCRRQHRFEWRTKRVFGADHPYQAPQRSVLQVARSPATTV